ncbi:Carotenoid oxygenase [Penicillium lagena]|uniref:Carotenoid oxygenase n=1 Tax=Penicillium lagena TaxID=94218 RepID=UPI002542486A|nr:Carotenoid oxygenase [Penicillium lagena]KAJ5612532.1 Carotenoid oxygenase [Penicillium lagena]
MSSIAVSSTAVASNSQAAEEHFNNWPNDKGFDPEFEERSPVELSVTGHIPAYAAGTLYRTGPGKSKVDTENDGIFHLSHWFDGFSQTHRFQIMVPDNVHGTVRVFYNSRFSTDALIESVRKTGSLERMGFGQKRDPCKSVFNKVQSEHTPPQDPSAVNVGVTLSVNMPGLNDTSTAEPNKRWDGSKRIQNLYAKTDYSTFKKLDPETLEPIGLASQADLHPDLNGHLSASHARSDPNAGDVFNFNCSLGPTSTYRVFQVSTSTGKTTILATFPGTPAYLHSLVLTEDYVLLCVWNSHLNPMKLAGGSFMDAIMPMDPTQPATWYVIDRRKGQGLVAKYESPAFFCFHTINAWQEPSKEDPSKTDVVADLVRLESPEFLKTLYFENLISTSSAAKTLAEQRDDSLHSSFSRFRLHAVPSAPTTEIGKASIEWSECQALNPELPTMNPNFITRRHQYVYAVTFGGKSTFTDSIMKFNCETKETHVWSHHEALFIADPNGSNEDDGVLLSVVLDGMRGKSYLLCLDAHDLTELGRANVNGPVGFGFHGQHVPRVGLPTGDY